MSEYNVTEEKDKELLELIKPLQKWLIKYYDPMCKIEITDGHVKVYRSELRLLQYVEGDENIESIS